MQITELTHLTYQVLWAAFVISVLFGAIVQHTHFCAMGAVSDVFNMGDWTRMRQWGLAVGIAMIGVGLLSHTGQLDLTKTLYASNRLMWLSATVGGLMFGFGMVLGSGCGSKTLVRIGGGSLKSVVVFLMVGVSAFATLKGITAVIRVASVDQVALDVIAGATFPSVIASLLGLQTSAVNLVCALLLGGSLCLWAFLGKDFVNPINLSAGVGIGLLIVAAWWSSGHFGYILESPETLQEAFLRTNSGKSESLSFVAPIAYTLDWLMFFSDQSKVLTVGIVSVFGLIVGSAASALIGGSFRWEGFGSVEDLVNHLVGGLLMGLGGITAMGCTVGQGLSGVATLNLTSFVAVFSIIGGAVFALRYQVWRLERLG